MLLAGGYEGVVLEIGSQQCLNHAFKLKTCDLTVVLISQVRLMKVY